MQSQSDFQQHQWINNKTAPRVPKSAVFQIYAKCAQWIFRAGMYKWINL